MTYPNMISQSLTLGIEGVFVKIILCKVTVNEGEPQECWCPNNFFLNANIFLLLVFFFEAKVTLVICPNIIWEKVITHTAMKTMEILILITMMKVVLNELTSKRLVMGHFWCLKSKLVISKCRLHHIYEY